jgi:hypothetical protein
MELRQISARRVAGWAHWLILGATYALALGFAVYLFLVGPALWITLLVAGALTARWPITGWLFPVAVFTVSATAAGIVVVVSWGTDAAWAGPLMIWIFDAFLIVTFKFGQLVGLRRQRRRAALIAQPG